MNIQVEFATKAKNIKLLILDVDGVMTDGGLYFDNNGKEIKRYNALDGQGIKFAQMDGIAIAVITARENLSMQYRAKDLGIQHLLTNRTDKFSALCELQAKLNITFEEIAYIGDDVLDLSVMTRISLPIAVANAHHEVKKRAIYVTKNLGGHGAIREVIDMLLYARGSYNTLMGKYFKDSHE